MKTLLLLRHGKSDWNAEYSRDLERPLAPRGVKAAAKVGRFLKAAALRPDRLLCSPAVRARATADLAAEAGEWDCPLEVVPSLYGGSVEEVLAAVHEGGGDADILLLAGHEPTWSRVTEHLTGARARVPTACLVAIGVEAGSWKDLGTAPAELQWLLPPRLLKKAGW